MGTAEGVLVILGSAVGVLAAVAALARTIWRFAQDLRDNKTATQENTRQITALGAKLDALAMRIDQGANPWRRY